MNIFDHSSAIKLVRQWRVPKSFNLLNRFLNDTSEYQLQIFSTGEDAPKFIQSFLKQYPDTKRLVGIVRGEYIIILTNGSNILITVDSSIPKHRLQNYMEKNSDRVKEIVFEFTINNKNSIFGENDNGHV